MFCLTIPEQPKEAWVNKRVLLLGIPFFLALGLGTWAYYDTRPHAPELPNPPLKDLADKHNVQLGNFAILTHLGDKPYTDILTSQFHFVTADNTPNWYFTGGGLRPSATTYHFNDLDKIFAFAESHHMPVQVHHFLWGEEKWLPDWLKNSHYDKQQLMDLMHDHIMTVGGRYRGRVREWTVVNEAFSRNLHMFGLRDWWADNTGSMDYIDQAFTWAHQADPNAKLILNDFQNEGENDISNAMYDYIKGAKARGVPIDGIGMQMHIDGTHPTQKDEVVSNMKRFGELGVEVYVTELDVNMNDVPADSMAKDQQQAKIYYEMMRACIESKVCHSFALLGITDKETWYNYLGIPDSRPLPFDNAYQPKAAFFEMRRALEEQ